MYLTGTGVIGTASPKCDMIADAASGIARSISVVRRVITCDGVRDAYLCPPRAWRTVGWKARSIPEAAAEAI